MIRSICHTGLVVRDIGRSIAFYEALGLTVCRRETETGAYIDAVVGIPAVKVEWAQLRVPDGSLLELLQYHSHPDICPVERTPANRLGCSHIAFAVENLPETCERVMQLGGSKVNAPAISPNGEESVVYCRDLDGILIELVEDLKCHN